jgi:hypothetical protein
VPKKQKRTDGDVRAMIAKDLRMRIGCADVALDLALYETRDPAANWDVRIASNAGDWPADWRPKGSRRRLPGHVASSTSRGRSGIRNDEALRRAVAFPRFGADKTPFGRPRRNVRPCHLEYASISTCLEIEIEDKL